MLHNLVGLSNEEHIFGQLDLSRRTSTLLSQNKGKINPSWVLLDSQATIDTFCNPKLLKFIKEVNETVEIHCNASTTTTNKVGYLKGYGMVWFDPNGIANILLMHRVVYRYHVQFDSRDRNTFIVWRDNGSSREFLPGPRGLYYCDVTKTHATILTMDGKVDDAYGSIDLAYITTVKEKMKGFTQREIKNATTARKFQNTAGLTTAGIISVVDKKMLNNCPITRESIKHAVGI